MFKIEIDNELHLELVHLSHAQEAFALVEKNRELFRTWLDWVDDSKSVDDTKVFINHELLNYANQKSVNCMMFYKNRMVGNVALLGIRKAYGMKRGFLGYWLDADFHGKGVMYRAVKKMIALGFEHYALDKITLQCAVLNNRSCNVAQKLGFTHEGLQRDEIKVNGKIMDANVYAILKREWEEDKEKFQDTL